MRFQYESKICTKNNINDGDDDDGGEKKILKLALRIK